MTEDIKEPPVWVTAEDLTEDLKKVIQEISGDKKLHRFRAEYEKLFQHVQNFLTEEKRLRNKCKELTAEIGANASKVEDAINLSDKDKGTIESLKKELEKAWKAVDESHAREHKARETIQALKLEVASQGSKGAEKKMSEDEAMIAETIRMKEEFQKQIDALLEEAVTLRLTITQGSDEVNHLQKKIEVKERTVAQLQQNILQYSIDIQKEGEMKAASEKQLKELTAAMTAKTWQIKALEVSLDKSKKNAIDMDKKINELKSDHSKTIKDLEDLSFRHHKLLSEHEYQTSRVDQLVIHNHEKSREIELKDIDLKNKRKEIDALNKQQEIMKRKLFSLDEKKRDLEAEQDRLAAEKAALQNDLENAKKQSDQDKKAITELYKKKAELLKNLKQEESTVYHQQDLAEIHEQLKENLESECQKLRENAVIQRGQLTTIKKEKDSLQAELQDMSKKLVLIMEESKLKEEELLQLRRQTVDSESHLRQQQNIYEAIRTDYNLHSKKLTNSQNEVSDLQAKLRVAVTQIENLKDEVNRSTATIINEEKILEAANQEKSKLSEEVKHQHALLLDGQNKMRNQELEYQKLLNQMESVGQEKLNVTKELEKVVSERDSFHAQLTKKHQELSLLYSKLQSQQGLFKVEQQGHHKRLTVIHSLQQEVNRLKQERQSVARNMHSASELRQKLFLAERELLKERNYHRALEEDLQKPLNIHRWRKLQGADPERYHLVMKINALQKCLIQKTKEGEEQQAEINEQQRLCMELQHTLVHQPSPKIAMKLQECQQELQEKNSLIKSLHAKISTYEAILDENKKQTQEVTMMESSNVKTKYYEHKKGENLSAEASSSSRNAGRVLPTAMSGTPKFMGGGYRMTPNICYFGNTL